MAQLGQDSQIFVSVTMPQVVHGYLHNTSVQSEASPAAGSNPIFVQNTKWGAKTLSWSLLLKYFDLEKTSVSQS